MGLEIEGIDEWKREAREVIRQYPEKGAEFLDNQGKKLAQMVKSRTKTGPTGKLKKSWRRNKPKEKNGVLKVEVKSTAPHAHLYEYGHRLVLVRHLKRGKKKKVEVGFVPGRFPLQTSFDDVEKDWDSELESWFDDLVKELEV